MDPRSVWTLISVDLFARVSYGLARTPALPLYAAFLGAGPEWVGLVAAAGTITGVLLKLPSGALSDAVGRRPLLLAGLLVFGTGPFLYLVVPSVPVLAGVRLYHGLATAIYSPVVMAAVARLAAERRGEYLAWLSNSQIAGKLLGAFLGGVALSVAGLSLGRPGGLLARENLELLFGRCPGPSHLGAADFQRAYAVAAAFGVAALALGLLVLRRLPEEVPAERPQWRKVWSKFGAGVREVGSDARVLLASGSESVQNLSVGLVESFLPLYAVFVAGHSPLRASLLYAVQVATTVAAKPISGRWSDRRGRRGVIVLGMVLCALPLAAIPWVRGFGPLAALALLFGLGEAFVTSSSAALVADLCKERSLGAAMGVFGTVADCGHALGPILGGVLLAAFAPGGAAGAGDAFRGSAEPYRFVFGTVAAALLVYTAVFVFVRKGGETAR